MLDQSRRGRERILSSWISKSKFGDRKTLDEYLWFPQIFIIKVGIILPKNMTSGILHIFVVMKDRYLILL